jgi:alkanesulfonate monooxygenase SsuD/methylene tetrahydromethanopterin reductase-like flavin-dependent oxidoreductase (luciferase family)
VLNPTEPMFGVSVNNLSRVYGLPDLLRAAQEAEALGFDGIWVHDAPMARRTVAAWDPVAVLTAVAQVTKQLRLCTGIIQPHLRNPFQMAVTWATLHELSGGRTLMGVGLGAGVPRLVKREYQNVAALRTDAGPDPDALYAQRGKLFNECLDLLNRLWTQDKVTYHGQYYHLEEVTLGLARPTRSKPDILVAAGSYTASQLGGPRQHEWTEDAAGRFRLGRWQRVVQYGDGWITSDATPEEYAEAWARMQAHLAESPRRGVHLARAYNCFVNVNPDRERGHAELKAHLEEFHAPPFGDDLVARWGFTGSGEEIAERLSRYIERGVSIFQLVIGSTDQFGQMRLIARDVLPRLRAAYAAHRQAQAAHAS